MIKIEVYQSPKPEVGVFVIPNPAVAVYRLCGSSMNIALSGQQFENDEDIGIRVHVTTTDRNQNIAGTVVILDVFDATTTPEQFLLSKDNGDGADPTYNGGGNLIQITPDRLTLDFTLNKDTDLVSLPSGQRTLSYKIYTVLNGRRCFRGKGQFIRRAA
jgi:hypothetical protein